jgi:hypothetical protein
MPLGASGYDGARKEISLFLCLTTVKRHMMF